MNYLAYKIKEKIEKVVPTQEKPVGKKVVPKVARFFAKSVESACQYFTELTG